MRFPKRANNLCPESMQVDELTSETIKDTAAHIFTEENCFTGYVLPKA